MSSSKNRAKDTRRRGLGQIRPWRQAPAKDFQAAQRRARQEPWASAGHYERMNARTAAAEWRTAHEEALHCKNCPLWRNATQTVFGEGPLDAPLMFVGEQPGDKEDIAGKPFVGPAGRILDRALTAAGIARDKAYVTNAVKHFKFVPRGKIRCTRSPTRRKSRPAVRGSNVSGKS
jgi:DNA polymerase